MRTVELPNLDECQDGMYAEFVSLEAMKRAMELLPVGSSVTVKREDILNAFPTEMATKEAVADDDKLLTADEVAAMLNVSVRWCYDHKKQLGGKNLSLRKVRFPESAVKRFMNRGGL